MKTKSTVIALSAVIATLGLGVLAAACHRGPGHGPMDPERIDKFVTFHLDDALDEIEATAGQKRQIMAIKDDILGQVLAQREAHLADRLVFLQEIQRETPDRARLHGLVDKRLDALRVVAHKGLDSLLDAQAVLTPEQRQMIQAKVRQRHGCAADGK